MESFVNLSEFPIIRTKLASTELCDKVCWLLKRKDEASKDIRTKAMKFLITMITPETVSRISKNLRGKLKKLVTDKDQKIVFVALLLLKKISSFPQSQGVMNFDLTQALMLNLGHSSKKIFEATIEILSSFEILEKENYIKVMFSTQALSNILKIFPLTNDPKIIKFLIAIIHQFSHDLKMAGSLMSQGGEQLFVTLVK